MIRNWPKGFALEPLPESIPVSSSARQWTVCINSEDVTHDTRHLHVFCEHLSFELGWKKLARREQLVVHDGDTGAARDARAWMHTERVMKESRFHAASLSVHINGRHITERESIQTIELTLQEEVQLYKVRISRLDEKWCHFAMSIQSQ